MNLSEFGLKVAMEENAVQFVNETGLLDLQAFIKEPNCSNLRLLVHAPALYKVADREFGMAAQVDAATLAVFRWIFIRVHVVLHQLKDQGIRPEGVISPQIDQWPKV